MYAVTVGQSAQQHRALLTLNSEIVIACRAFPVLIRVHTPAPQTLKISAASLTSASQGLHDCWKTIWEMLCCAACKKMKPGKLQRACCIQCNHQSSMPETQHEKQCRSAVPACYGALWRGHCCSNDSICGPDRHTDIRRCKSCQIIHPVPTEHSGVAQSLQDLTGFLCSSLWSHQDERQLTKRRQEKLHIKGITSSVGVLHDCLSILTQFPAQAIVALATCM